jgi:hypothetical protein
VLQNNGGDNLTVQTNGNFSFATQLTTGASYLVTIFSQPTGQTCSITNGSGLINRANVADISVTCITAFASTTVIQTNMQINYQNESSNVSLAVSQCVAQYRSSGAGTTCSASAKQGAVQNFLNVMLANIQALKSSTPIDKVAIATMFQAYQTQDLAWLSVGAIGPTTTTSLINAVSGSYYSSVNTSYSNALIQLAGM